MNKCLKNLILISSMVNIDKQHKQKTFCSPYVLECRGMQKTKV